MRKEEFKEGLGDLAHAAELDHEVQMARSDLYKIAKYAIKLHEMLKGVSEQEGLEGWVQAKITKAAEGLGNVYHNLDYKMNFEKKNEPSDMEVEMPFESAYKGSLARHLTKSLQEKIGPGQNPDDYNPLPGFKPRPPDPTREFEKPSQDIKMVGPETIEWKGYKFDFSREKVDRRMLRFLHKKKAPMSAVGIRGMGTVAVYLDPQNQTYYDGRGLEEAQKSDDDPCWKNYKMVGTKKMNGKQVPNCVPK